MKKKYITPTLNAVKIKTQHYLLIASQITTQGLGVDNLTKGDNTEPQGDDMFNDAW